MKKKCIMALGLALFFLSFPCLAEEAPQVKTSKTPRLASLQKSLLLPGWGQISEKKILKGILFITAEAFCVYEIFRFNHKGNLEYEKYKTAATVEEAVHFRQLTEDHDTRRNQYLLLAAGVWAVNLLDIYLINKKKDKNKNLRITIEKREKQSLAVTFSYTF